MALKLSTKAARRLLEGNKPKTADYFEIKSKELEEENAGLVYIIQTYRAANDRLVQQNDRLVQQLRQNLNTTK